MKQGAREILHDVRVGPWQGDGYELTLGQNGDGVWTLELATYFVTRLLDYLPITSQSFNIAQCDFSIYAAQDMPKPSCTLLLSNNLVDQWGAAHGPALAIWMNAQWDRQTYFVKDTLRNTYFMQRGDWCATGFTCCSDAAHIGWLPVRSPLPTPGRFHGQDWYETWMAWEDLNDAPEWPLQIMADNLREFLTDTCGWEVVITDDRVGGDPAFGQ